MSTVVAFVPLLVSVTIVSAVIWFANWFLLRRRTDLGNERRFPRQMAMLVLTLLGIVTIALTLPVGESSRNQVIAFIGLVVSGIFAFSSTTLFANLMAGLMMRITRPFRAGDFIRVKDFFGRVSERGLLDTEIQTETRELISVPNTVLINHPVSVIRSSGTIVSVSVSLGYDLHHSRIEPLLLEAAAAASLEEPFVHVTQIGDFSVTYRINGLLKDVKSILTARSTLYRAVLDTLHRENIEIVSPAFTNQRRLQEDQHFVPQPIVARSSEPETQAEAIVFDKAEEAEKTELEQIRLTEEISALEAAVKTAPEGQKQALENRLKRSRDTLTQLNEASS